MGQCCAGVLAAWSPPPPPVKAPADKNPCSRKEVVKPVRPLDQPAEGPRVQSWEALGSTLGLVPAPPGAAKPLAFVSKDYQRNCARLLVLVPKPGAPPGTWDPSLPQGRGTICPLLRWAEANDYAAVVFSGQELERSPTELWDRVLKGSPSRYVVTFVADGMLSTVRSGLSALHPLLLSRYRTICITSGDVATVRPSEEASFSEELHAHLLTSCVLFPTAFEQLEPEAARQDLFELLHEREGRWQDLESKKFAGFQALKENDLPGFRRLGVDERIKRLDRDRGNDELAQLIRKHQRQAGGHESEEEPGVD